MDTPLLGHGTDMAVQQKEDVGPEGEARGGEESGELREGAGGRPEGQAGGQDPPRGQGFQGRDEIVRWKLGSQKISD